MKNRCLCIEKRFAIQKAIKEAMLEDIHLTRPGCFALLSLAQHCWWPYIHRDLLARASECKACTDIGKNLKPLIPRSKWLPLTKCNESNEEMQIDFRCPNLNKKVIQKFFLIAIDRYFKYLS